MDLGQLTDLYVKRQKLYWGDVEETLQESIENKLPFINLDTFFASSDLVKIGENITGLKNKMVVQNQEIDWIE